MTYSHAHFSAMTVCSNNCSATNAQAAALPYLANKSEAQYEGRYCLAHVAVLTELARCRSPEHVRYAESGHEKSLINEAFFISGADDALQFIGSAVHQICSARSAHL